MFAVINSHPPYELPDCDCRLCEGVRVARSTPDFAKLPDPPDRDPHDIWMHAFTLLCLALIALCLFMVARS